MSTKANPKTIFRFFSFCQKVIRVVPSLSPLLITGRLSTISMKDRTITKMPALPLFTVPDTTTALMSIVPSALMPEYIIQSPITKNTMAAIRRIKRKVCPISHLCFFPSFSITYPYLPDITGSTVDS